MGSALPAASRTYHASTRQSGKEVRMVLIVDDDPEVCSSLERLFRYAGYEAVSVQKPGEVLSLLSVRKPRAIILDLNLPLLSGITLLRAIRRDPRLDSVAVVVYTADFAESQEKIAREAGAQDYIVKGTLGWDALLQRVDQLVLPRSPGMRLSS